MQIIGFNLAKIQVERFEGTASKFKVNSKIDVKDIAEEKMSPIQGKAVAKIDFEYNIEYDPKIAELHFKGTLLLMADPKDIKDTVAEWKKKNSILTELKIKIYNAIFHKCNLKALELEDYLGMPIHIQLPHIKSEQESKTTYTG